MGFVVVHWYKADGDYVRKGELVCRLATDQNYTEVEIEAPNDGTLKRLKGTGEEVKVDEPCARIDPSKGPPRALGS